MEITLNVDVECKDGLCGRSTHIIVNPITKRVTHFVVRDRALPKTERLVPVSQIEESSHDGIMLKCNRNELCKMTPFLKQEFVEVNDDEFVVDSMSYDKGEEPIFLWPYVSTRVKRVGIKTKQIPLDAVDVRRGARVDATDGRIGRVDEFLVDPDTMNMTHLVMTEGHLWGETDILIPMDAVAQFSDNAIKLALSKKEVAALPLLPVHRHFTPVTV